MELLAREGHRSGRLLRHFKERIDRPLIAILATNTVANMFGAAGVGAEASTLARSAGKDDALWVGLASGALTLAILVCSEIVPKTLGATYWRALAAPSAYVLWALVTVLRPVIVLLEAIPRSLTRPQARESVSREEIAVIADVAGRSGSLRARENSVIENLLAMSKLRTHDIMTPRVEVFSLTRATTAHEAATRFAPLRYSRIPVHDGSLDKVEGIVLRSTIFEACFRGRGDMPIGKLMKPAMFVPESQPTSRLLDEFIARGAHLFVVVNEYGGTEGLVTLEDAVETLLGVEIVDELDPVADLRERARARLARRRSAHSAEDESFHM